MRSPDLILPPNALDILPQWSSLAHSTVSLSGAQLGQKFGSNSMNKAAQSLARKRWNKIPKAERGALVPRNGGRKRRYPQCARYKAHRFVADRCPCGFTRA